MSLKTVEQRPSVADLKPEEQLKKKERERGKKGQNG